MISSSPAEKAVVIRGMVTGAATTILVISLGSYLLPPGSEARFPTAVDKVVYTLRWQSVTALTFIFGISRIATMRFHTPAIDPIAGKGEGLIAVDLRYLQNTLEQLVLSVLGQVILSTYLSASSVPRIIPSLVGLFVLGRILFYYGYAKGPLYRAVGFGMTYYPSILVHAYCLWCFLFS